MQSISTSSSKALYFVSDRVQKKLGTLRPASDAERDTNSKLTIKNDIKHKYRDNSKQRQ